MKKKKNGFIFMETVIVVGVLSVTLLLLYSSYEFIIRKSKEKVNFETTESIYKTYFTKQIIDSLYTSAGSPSGYGSGVEWYVKTHTSECSIIKKTASTNSSSYKCNLYDLNYNGDLRQVTKAYNVDKIYYVTASDINARENYWLNQFDATTIDYIKTLPKQTKNIIIVKVNNFYYRSNGGMETLHCSIEV